MSANLSTNNYPEPVNTRDTVYAVDRVPAVPAGQIRRIAWGAVFAGLVLAVVTQMALYLLGLSIGALTVNPLTEQAPFEGLGTATVIWDAATTLIALFIGGWVAGRLAGIPSQTDGAIHGLVVWATSVIVSVLLFTTTVGGLVNGTVSLLGQTASAAGVLLEDIAPQTSEAVQDVAEATGLTISGEELREQVLTTVADDTDLTVEVTDDEAFTRGLTDFAVAASQDGVTTTEREALQDALAASTTLSEAEIEQFVASAERNISQFTQQVEQTAAQVREEATVAAENAAEIIAAVAGALFASLVVGAFAAGLGGFVGAPEVTAEMEVAT